MPRSKKKKYWFRAKQYGWGWSIPFTWQGWVVLFIFFAVFITTLIRLFPRRNTFNDIVPFLIIIWLDVVFLMAMGLAYGEPARWRWGNKKK